MNSIEEGGGVFLIKIQLIEVSDGEQGGEGKKKGRRARGILLIGTVKRLFSSVGEAPL